MPVFSKHSSGPDDETASRALDRNDAFDSLQTSRLVLRKPRLADAPLIFETYGQDAEVTRYLMWPPHNDVKDAQAAVQRFLKGWESGTQFCWLILLKTPANSSDPSLLGRARTELASGTSWPVLTGVEVS